MHSMSRLSEHLGHTAKHQHLSLGELTVRNLTATRLTVDVGIVLNSLSASSTTATHDNAQLSIEAFTATSAAANNEKEQTGVVSQIDIPQSLTLTSDVLNSTSIHNSRNHSTATTGQRITPIYDPTNRFLTLFESPDLSCWMKDFRDDTSLAALSIPGTHNSPTYHWALPSVRCQAVSPLEQIHNGVRFFDLRVQPHRPEDPNSEDLYLVHGAFPISLIGGKKFRHLIHDVEAFLKANPTETLIISVKREGTGKATNEQLAEILATHYAKDWYTEPRIPTVGEARGKIVLMRRFSIPDRLKKEHNGTGWGLDAESWQDNTANCVHGQVCVQDFYEVMNTQLISKKIEVSCAQFERAGSVVCPVPGKVESATPAQIYLNFLTASNFFNFRCWPENIAAKLNPAVTSFLCEKHDCGNSGDGGLGIVVCDWVGKNGNWDLVKCIIGMNARRLYRERGYAWNGPAQ